MADEKISALTSAGALAGTEPLPIVQGGNTVKTTVQDVANLVATPDLQQVLDEYNVSTTQLEITDSTNSVIIQPNQLKIANGTGYGTIAAANLTADPNFELPDKPSGTYTFAMLSDVTTGGLIKATAAGTDTYTTTISGVASYTDGDAYLVRFTNGNTTAATLNINSLGAKSLYRNNDGAIIGGDIWDGGEMLCVYNSTLNAFQCIGTSPNSIFAYVTNDDSVSITKGQVVYAFGGTGDRMTVKLANNTSDATSARTVGVVLSTSIAANQKGIIILQGLLDGLSILPTSTYADGDSIYLGATAGSITNVKPYAPNHLVYVATVTTASNGSAGRMYVKIQNGYELDELHNVQAQSPSLKDTLWYDNTVSPAQWKTASISTILGYTPISATSTDTLTNKRITARSGTVASAATPTINTDNVDYYSITALAAAITSFTTNLSGTPTIGQTLWISIKDNGTARAITWGASFESSTITLPTTTVISTRLDVAFIWNELTSVWRCVGVA